MHAHQRDSPQMRLAAEGELHCMQCESGQLFGGSAYPWRELSIKKLGTGLAGRRKEAQAEGLKLARKLKPGEFFAVQAREQWSTTEAVHERPGHFWVAQAGLNFKPEVAAKRITLGGTIFAQGDIIVRIGRYFDREISDPSGLTFEEWQPITVFSEEDKCWQDAQHLRRSGQGQPLHSAGCVLGQPRARGQLEEDLEGRQCRWWLGGPRGGKDQEPTVRR